MQLWIKHTRCLQENSETILTQKDKNFRWFTLVGTGMLVHLSDMCLMGMCCQHKEFDAPNLGSALFTFSTLVIITAHSLIPPAMCNMHKALALIFEMGLSLVICDFSLQTMWFPLMGLLEKGFAQLSDYIKNLCESAGVQEMCSCFTSVLESKTALHVFASFIAVILTIYTLDSTETFTQFRNYFSGKMGCPAESMERSRPRRRRGNRSRNRGCDTISNEEEEEYEEDE